MNPLTPAAQPGKTAAVPLGLLSKRNLPQPQPTRDEAAERDFYSARAVKRHSWETISQRRSMIRNTVSRCRNCSLERAQYMDFGHHRVAFRVPGGKWVESKTPACKGPEGAR